MTASKKALKAKTKNKAKPKIKAKTKAKTKTKAQRPMSVMDAIYSRRSVRDFKPKTVGQDIIQTLLDAAVHAPTAMHEEPWSFVIVQDKTLLHRLSESAKSYMRKEKEGSPADQAKHVLALVNRPGFEIFYNASTLILICSKVHEATGVFDCWLAAQNLMLAAHAKGLGTCVIGLSSLALTAPEWRAELGIPVGTTVVVPLILGEPAKKPPISLRKPPEILAWK